MLVFICMLGVVFSRLFHQSLKEYVPFFTAGFLFWTFLSSSLLEAGEIFKANEGFIKQINLPFHLYVFKHLVKQTICLMHNFVVYLLVCVFFKLNPGFVSLLVLPGLLLLLLNMYWICFLIAMICSRFRDVLPIISNCVQIAFFVTPISWMPQLMDLNPLILKLNPLVYLLDVLRSPLLGQLPSCMSCLVTGGIAVVGIGITFFIFSHVRTKIAFWVD
jgi:lipopolysaccharide transport system permease protein